MRPIERIDTAQDFHLWRLSVDRGATVRGYVIGIHGSATPPFPLLRLAGAGGVCGLGGFGGGSTITL